MYLRLLKGVLVEIELIYKEQMIFDVSWDTRMDLALDVVEFNGALVEENCFLIIFKFFLCIEF